MVRLPTHVSHAETIAFSDAPAFEAWLAEHVALHVGVWLKIAKKGSGIPSLTIPRKGCGEIGWKCDVSLALIGSGPPPVGLGSGDLGQARVLLAQPPARPLFNTVFE